MLANASFACQPFAVSAHRTYADFVHVLRGGTRDVILRTSLAARYLTSDAAAVHPRCACLVSSLSTAGDSSMFASREARSRLLVHGNAPRTF